MLPNVQRTDAADHIPVLAEEVRELLSVQPGETVQVQGVITHSEVAFRPRRTLVCRLQDGGDERGELQALSQRRDHAPRRFEGGGPVGLSENRSDYVDFSAVHLSLSREYEVAARLFSETGLDAHHPVLTQEFVYVAHQADARQADLRRTDDLREDGVLHRNARQHELVHGRAHRGRREAAGIRVGCVRHAQGARFRVHLLHEGRYRTCVPVREDLGEVVRRRDQHAL